MSYKTNAAANRDDLFGGAGGGGGSSGPKHKRDASSNRNALFGNAAGGGGSSSRPSSSRPTSTPTTTTTKTTTAQGYNRKKKSTATPGTSLSAEAKAAKLKEAEDFRQKANKCMQKGLFARPDPVAASTYYKRAADCYKAIGDYRNERHYRVSSGQCNMMIAAWGSAASDYTRAAELTLEFDGIDANNDIAQRRRDAANYHKKAAEAWTQMNERSKAAKSTVEAALALNYGQEGTMLSKESLECMEEAIEAHVPDVLNPYARYRQTGHSAFVDPNSEETVEFPSEQTLQLANEHLVSKSYSHEPLLELVNVLVGFGEYASALYAAGAASYILERDGISTLTLSRVYVVETILTLAMGDPIAAEQQFLNKHVQKTSYLSSRECKLAEDLFRAIKMRDADALEEARSPSGSNRAALGNLNESLRVLVTQLRISGVARKTVEDTSSPTTSSKPKKKSSPTASSKPKKKSPSRREKEETPPPPKEETSLQDLLNKPTGYEAEAEAGANMDGDALAAELNGLDFGDDGEEELDDDDFDLR